MPTLNKITQEEAPPVKSAEELEMEALLSASDDVLVNLEHSLSEAFRKVWGTPENPRDKAEVEALLNVNPASTALLFTRHAAQVQALEGSGAVTFEAWEKVPAYAATFAPDLSSVTLADDLAQAWVDAQSESE